MTGADWVAAFIVVAFAALILTHHLTLRNTPTAPHIDQDQHEYLHQDGDPS